MTKATLLEALLAPARKEQSMCACLCRGTARLGDGKRTNSSSCHQQGEHTKAKQILLSGAVQLAFK